MKLDLTPEEAACLDALLSSAAEAGAGSSAPSAAPHALVLALSRRLAGARAHEPRKFGAQGSLDPFPVDITVFTRKWNTDRPGEGEEWNASLHSRVLVNGHEEPWISGVTVAAQGGEFVEAKLSVLPRQVRFVALGEEDWAREALSDLL